MKLLITLLLFVFVGTSYGQTYSQNKEKFVKEFQKVLTEYGKGEFSDFAKKDLPMSLVEMNEFPDEYFTTMVLTCNLLETKRMDPYPEIYNYVYSVYSFVKGKQSKESFNAWQSTIDKLLASRNPKKFTDFAEMSAGFFSQRQLNAKSNYSWYYFGGTYRFEYDKEPSVIFEGGDLVCRIENTSRSGKEEKYIDSLVIYKTKGVFDPILKKWDGNGGTITWEKNGLDKNKIFAEIKGYDLSLKATKMNADSAKFTSPYFPNPIYGTLKDEAFKINREEDKIYPMFLSNEKNLKINNIRPNLDYEGGFAMQGAKFVGAGSASNPSKLTLHRNNEPFIVTQAANIFLTDEKVYASSARVKIIMNTGDSIYHPGLNFNYFLGDKEVVLSRPSSGIGQSPFSDSYHKLDFYIPSIIWKEGDSKLIFTFEKGTSQEQRMARFESQNYFDARLYNKLQGMAALHPLVAIHNYSYKYDKITMTEGECATALGGTIDQAKPMMLQLANLGFISYDSETKIVVINQKLENFVKGRAGKQDFDNINFVTDLRPKKLEGYSSEQIKDDPYLQDLEKLFAEQSKERNRLNEFGSMSIGTLDMSLHAVDRVTISEKQNANVFPEGGEVLIKQNRDFEFSGWMNAGKLESEATLAYYNYEENKVNLIETKNTLLRIRPLQKEHGTSGIPMGSFLSKLEGEVFIDAPNNRSGNQESDELSVYPKLKTNKPSFVYYNSQDIYRGAYDSTRFYYTVNPFELDSLDDFEERAFRLSGELTSAGIFPKIKEDLKIMPDYSFGFSTTAPSGGYNFYGDEAKYENKIVLSNNGLQGKGEINFVHSKSISPALTFLPDSTVGLADFVNKGIESGIQFPDVKSHKAYITYIPKQNILKAASTPDNDLEFFGSEAKLRGTAFVTPEGMKGDGTMSFVTATVRSHGFDYKRWDIDADTSSFNLKNSYKEEGEDPLAFETTNVNAHISFEERKGEFKSNDGESTVQFPVNQYICKMDMFTWFMDEESIEMEKAEEKELTIDTGLDLVGPNFFSVHPKQDSLQFRAPKAKFNMKEKTIYCSKVEFLDVADARIYPDSMKINIRKKAKMDRLENSKIVANYITKYHSFEKASVQITARRAYEGTGVYPYYDKDSIPTYVQMDKIGLDTSFQTIASGKIGQDMNFKLSEEFDYYGDLAVKAANPYAYFTGATRINHSCDKFERNWLSFSAEINPTNIQIPVAQQMKNLDGEPISAGLVWRDANAIDSIRIYPTFLSKLEDEKDPIVMTSSGFLSYNFDAKEFQIGTKEKLINRKTSGNFLALHTESCSMNGEGMVDLGLDLGDVDVQSIGVVNYDQTTGKTSMNLTMKFDMALDKGMMKGVGKRIRETEGLQPMDLNSNTLEQALVNWSTEKDANKLKEDYTVKGEVKSLPKTLEQSSMTFTGIRLTSYDNPNDFQNRGLITSLESAVLVNMYDEIVMKYVPFRGFFQQRSSLAAGGDWFKMLIDIPGGRDYYFDYKMSKKDGVMDIATGDNELASTISEMKDDKKKTKDFSFKLVGNGAKSALFGLFE